MTHGLEPVVGHWYVHCDKGEMFQVVAFDHASRCIEIQTFDGAVAEIDRDVWSHLRLNAAEPPEDWTGPFDDLERDDRGLSDAAAVAPDWRRRVESLEVVDEPWPDAEVLE